MGVSVGDMIVTGGGGRSGLWRGMLADLYGLPVSTLAADEGAALGAAILAGVGAGLYPSLADACGRIVQKGSTHTPDMQKAEAYAPYFELYQQLYRSMKDDFQTLAKI
jgi:xylulokinase